MAEKRFLAALRESPRDYDLWLVFADWLDDQGDLRGELIRCFVERMRIDLSHPRTTGRIIALFSRHDEIIAQLGWPSQSAPCGRCEGTGNDPHYDANCVRCEGGGTETRATGPYILDCSAADLVMEVSQ